MIREVLFRAILVAFTHEWTESWFIEQISRTSMSGCAAISWREFLRLSLKCTEHVTFLGEPPLFFTRDCESTTLQNNVLTTAYQQPFENWRAFFIFFETQQIHFQRFERTMLCACRPRAYWTTFERLFISLAGRGYSPQPRFNLLLATTQPK